MTCGKSIKGLPKGKHSGTGFGLEHHHPSSHTQLILLPLSLFPCHLIITHLRTGWCHLFSFSGTCRIRSKLSTMAFVTQHGLAQIYVPARDSDSLQGSHVKPVAWPWTCEHSYAFVPFSSCCVLSWTSSSPGFFGQLNSRLPAESLSWNLSGFLLLERTLPLCSYFM